MKQVSIAVMLLMGAKAIKYVPEKASIHGDQGTYYTVPGGWSGQQVPGRQFERPDTGLDDETVLRKKNAFVGQESYYVPEVASIHGDQPLYYTVPGSWSGQQVPGRQFERPDTGLDDDHVLKKRRNVQKNEYIAASSEYVPDVASIHGDQPLYYTVPGSWSGQQIPGRQFERPDTGLDDEAVLKKKIQRVQSLQQYVPDVASIHGDQPLYYTVPGGWSGKQIPGRQFERPDTGLDDEAVLSKKRSFIAEQEDYVPEKASIHGDQGPYYTVPAGWSGQQVPGRQFERPDSGLDDETVLSKKRSLVDQGEEYVPEKASIHGDQPLYYTVAGGWSGQQIPGRQFERPDTGLDDEAVLSKRSSFTSEGSEYVPDVASIHGDQPLYYTVPGGWSGKQIPGRQFERPDTGLDDEAVLKKRQFHNQDIY